MKVLKQFSAEADEVITPMRHLILLLAICTTGLAQDNFERQLASAAHQRESLAAMSVSIQTQRVSVRRQVKLAPAADSFFVAMPPETSPVMMADCAALSPFEASGLVGAAARRAGIDPNLLHAVATQESAWRPCAVSPKGAQGLMQLMPATAADLGVKDPFDPVQSLQGGATLLKQLMTRYAGDLNRVLGAYNAGPARVDAVNGIPAIPETMNYVEKILGKLP